ncbi:hypothetical protein J2753_000344 [Halolamina salifodinae]|uniref:Uncharacterized protein n=1 Tax=Halolamina salifodinae TaxID=1202767 RepID=A0A8T4GRU8_9EURY|nr:hypothetical protein [Halolamina salifodinae]
MRCVVDCVDGWSIWTIETSVPVSDGPTSSVRESEFAFRHYTGEFTTHFHNHFPGLYPVITPGEASFTFNAGRPLSPVLFRHMLGTELSSGGSQ